ncbi:MULTISPECIES: hypothetical protein [unclassified Lentimonas]|uniref:hypothetical protein n=1 Tax=unclassified Lentimonas TaxID=2630993 RepID=UPI0013287E9E|nr:MULTISPECIES: hypothetical protein [unclassified Lentimonas]CAA6691458.1 Unannotated [Lentimonas sp. CC10]CAA6693784.1 Unannotated [Lentimonas sp. CC19]CAA7070958.1 Unannotated [Lentimonas sp. CC11]
MINQIFSLLVLFACGVILVFVCGVWLHFSMKKDNEKNRDKALKVQSSEPGAGDELN